MPQTSSWPLQAVTLSAFQMHSCRFRPISNDTIIFREVCGHTQELSGAVPIC